MMMSRWSTKETAPMRQGAQSLVHFLSAIGLGLALTIGTGSACAQRVLLDRIIALVDEGVVLQSELDTRVVEIRENAARANANLPEAEQLRSEVLDTLIIENLQMQLAERVSIRFNDDEINRILISMAENNNLSFDEYLNVLNEADVYLQTREQVRKQMTLQELQRGMVNRRIQITEQEIDNFLNSEMGREIMAPDFLVEHMLIPVGSGDPAKQDKLRFAADLVARIKDGESFAEVRAAAAQASLFQIDATEFGWLKAGALPNLFREIVEAMEVGDVEGPIEAGNGFHLIQLRNKAGGTEQMVKQTNFRHIMLSPNEIRDEQQTEDAIREFRQKIIDGEDFATLARQNSDDPGSVVAGGDMDWINEGQLSSDMASVIDALDIDSLSEPFRTTNGWHIAEVMERRVTDLSTIYLRNQAEGSLRNRKFDLELQNWLIEIREEAFVELVD
jgi:peptidyl-prolyl cis-trans isomerase SurA|tara:strand:+ start:152 stop:1492 length:1341 start_codon:yes stop_codon:yes gene_type:complete